MIGMAGLFFDIKSMPFQKGHKLGKGGARPGAGRKSKEQTAAMEALRREVEGAVKKDLRALVATYLRMAKEDQATMRHLIDKAMSNAKTEIDVTAHGVVEVFTNVDPHGSTKAD